MDNLTIMSLTRSQTTALSVTYRQQEIAKSTGSPEAEPKAARCYFETGWHETPVRLVPSLVLKACECSLYNVVQPNR